jgi:hypothetical protein
MSLDCVLERQMDPLSITAATIGISGAAIASIVSVRNTINSIQDAEKVVGDICTQHSKSLGSPTLGHYQRQRRRSPEVESPKL